jgi:hypothetical protein
MLYASRGVSTRGESNAIPTQITSMHDMHDRAVPTSDEEQRVAF